VTPQAELTNSASAAVAQAAFRRAVAELATPARGGPRLYVWMRVDTIDNARAHARAGFVAKSPRRLTAEQRREALET
jgi:hypothetical protein